jgi:hypothetical protein
MFFFMIFFMILKKRQFNRRVKYMIIWWNGLKKWNLASDFTSGDSASLYIRHFAKKNRERKSICCQKTKNMCPCRSVHHLKDHCIAAILTEILRSESDPSVQATKEKM